jgi:hypothetical protein
MSRTPVRVALAIALAAGTYGALALSRGGSGTADRAAFFADVARRLDIALPQRSPSLAGQQRFDTRTFRYRGRSLSVDATARYLGITDGEVRAELRLGGSLADVARRHGGTVDDLQRAIEDEVSRRLQGLSEDEQLRIAARLDDILRRDGRPAGWSAGGGP